jgi:fluoroquinolone transport system permease protein
MKTTTIFRTLGPIDARNVWRDSNLKWMVFLPVLLALIIRWGLPPLAGWLDGEYGFDLSPYYPAILSYLLVMLCPMTFGMVTGFLLIDEKDDDTLTALQVTPLPLGAYLVYRVTVPIVLSFVMLFVIFPLSGLDQFPVKMVLPTALAAAPIAPWFALTLASVAQNKVQGFALMKMLGAVLMLPVFAFFTDSAWAWLYGLIPTFWPMKLYWILVAGEPGAVPVLVIALVYPLALTWLLARRLDRQLHR